MQIVNTPMNNIFETILLVFMETTPTFFQPPQNSSQCSLNFEDTKLAGKLDPLFTMQEFTFLPVSVAG